MSWRSTIRKDDWKATIERDWRKSIMTVVPPVPVSKEKVKAEIIEMLAPEIKEKTSWKNTIQIEPKNGRDGKDGKRGNKIFIGNDKNKYKALEGDVFIDSTTGDLYQWED